MELIIVTGMSGAGKSRVVGALEDIGFFCADNIPPDFIGKLSELLSQSGEYRRAAVVTDSRSGSEFNKLSSAMQELNELNIPFKLLFVDAEDSVIIKRYKETRRKHPMSNSGNIPLDCAVKRERDLLKAAREKADIIFDTSVLSAIQCRVKVSEMFSDLPEGTMSIHCVSFGYKYGIPSDADLVFDVRGLPNPFYIPELKPLTGLDAPVYDYVMSFRESKEYAEKLLDFIDYALPLYRKEGRSQLVIAFGCTGGHHRSVTMARVVNEHLRTTGYRTGISHRDMEK